MDARARGIISTRARDGVQTIHVVLYRANRHITAEISQSPEATSNRRALAHSDVENQNDTAICYYF